MDTKQSERVPRGTRVSVGRQVRIAAVAVAGAAILASCSSGAAATADLSEADKTRIAEDYRECMATHGLDGNVSFDGGSINIDVGSLDAYQDPTDEQVKAAEEECEKLLEVLDSGTQLDPETEARLTDAAPVIQKCLNDKGYDVTVDGKGNISSESSSSDGDDGEAAESEYRLAEDECLKQALPDLYEKFMEGN